MKNYCKNNLNALISVILRYLKNKLLLNSSGMTSCSVLGLMQVLRVTTEIICTELNSHLEWAVNCQYVGEHLSILTKLFFTLTLVQTRMNRKLDVTRLSASWSLILLKEEEGKERKEQWLVLFNMGACAVSSELVRAEVFWNMLVWLVFAYHLGLLCPSVYGSKYTGTEMKLNQAFLL